MKKFLYLIILFSLIQSKHVIGQQNIQFSQYVFNGITINPGYAGYKEHFYVNAIYRKQWAGFPGAPVSGAVSCDGLVNQENKKSAFALQLSWDKKGPQAQQSLYGTYNYRIQLDDEDSKRLCIGMSFGFDNYSLDGTSFIYNDANDPSIPVSKISVIKPDAKVGAFYYTKKYYVGLSFFNLFSLNNPRTIFLDKTNSYPIDTKNLHMYLSAGYLINLEDNIVLKPSLLVKEDFHGPTSLDLNLFTLLAQRLWLGASYRTALHLYNKSGVDNSLATTGAVSFLTEIQATERLRFGYSYDINTSGLAGYQSGTHEISLGLLFAPPQDADRIKSPRYF